MERSVSGSVGMMPGGTEASTMDVQRQSGPPPPKAFPLSVRIRAVVADWGLEHDQRDEFLVAGPWPGSGSKQEDERDRTNPKASWLGDVASKNCDEKLEALSPGLVGGVLEHMVREVLAESDFDEIFDNMLMQDTPNFVQYDDTAPPGEQETTASFTVAELQEKDKQSRAAKAISG